MKHVRPPMELMREIRRHGGEDTDIALDVYCSPNVLLREFFWLRLRYLTAVINRVGKRRGTALDFGGGSGIFLPTLANGFESVRLIDRQTVQAAEMLAKQPLDNVELVSADIGSFEFPAGEFDAIVAADVLEHFAELDLPLTKIRRWLSDGGYLFTSLPTENWAYRALRVVFRKQKPADHYHSAAQVEAALRAAGFRKRFGVYHPLGLPIAPLFRISAWQKAPAEAVPASLEERAA